MKNKICLFGDSIGKGIIYDPAREKYAPSGSSFASLVSSREGLELDNFSRFGCTLVKGAGIVERHADELRSYDAVILQYGGNDSDFNWASVADSPEAEHDCNTPLTTFRNLYINTVKSIQSLGSMPVLLGLTPVDSGKYFRWISRSNDSGAIMRFLGDEERIERWNEMYNIAVCNVAGVCGVPFIDIRTPFLRRRDFHELFCEDGIHPNERGHRLIADTICSWRSVDSAASF